MLALLIVSILHGANSQGGSCGLKCNAFSSCVQVSPYNAGGAYTLDFSTCKASLTATIGSLCCVGPFGTRCQTNCGVGGLEPCKNFRTVAIQAAAGASSVTVQVFDGSISGNLGDISQIVCRKKEVGVCPGFNTCDLTISLPSPPVPPPSHQWTFNDGTARDSVGTANGIIYGNGETARITGGALVLNNFGVPAGPLRGHMTTAMPLTDTHVEKTLVAWVTFTSDQLTQQRAGGLLSMESHRNDKFDAIVYAELNPQEWLAGSSWWQRTVWDRVAPETSTAEIQMAIVYKADNSITVYRNGELYETHTPAASPLITYGPQDLTFVHIGLRASWPNVQENAWLSGSINEARTYNVALTQAQIRSLVPASN